ncbi:MAG: HAMP domain-containing protein [Chloroflexi bacterium]|nr:HAMP domain-containing protein [Chloroflexota bacterium]
MSLLGYVLLFTLIIFSLSVIYFVNQTESEAWQGRQSEAAQNAAGSVSAFIQRVRDAMLIVGVVEPGHLVTDSDELHSLLEENTALLEIVRTDQEGHVYASAFRDKSVLANLITIPQSQWFLKARQGETFLGDVQISAKNLPYLIMAVPSADGGVVAARVEMSVLWDVVKNIRFGRSGEVVVINHDGDIIAHTNPEYATSRQTIFGRPEFLEILNTPNHEWHGSYENFNNEQMVAATATIPGTSWIMIMELPNSEAFANSRAAVTALGVEAFFLLFAASWIAARYVRFQIVKPMEQLHDGADRIGRGDLKHRINPASMDELGRLAAAFNSMAADLEKQQGNLQKAIAYEYESQRARELDILLKASEATSSSLDFDTVMHTLAAQLLAICGFESCFISEWDKDANTIVGRLDHSKTFWREDKRDIYPMSDYPRSNQVLLTGVPIILQGDFEAEERQWMDELKRTAVMILALYSFESVIGLVEIATTKKNVLFEQQSLSACQKILADAAQSIVEPLSANEPKKLFEIEAALLQASGGEVCSFSEWDEPNNRIFNLAVSSNITWEQGQGTRFNPDLESWRLALDQGKTVTFVRSEDTTAKAVVFDGADIMDVESLVIFPLQKGNERIGVIELYDFNHRIKISPEQVTLLRTLADKAGYSIENARLLQLTQKKLDEQVVLLHEKEVLLKEIHHRVKNNLQIISSLLNLQASQVTDPQMLEALRDSRMRVRSMALIHEKLYQTQSLARINFGEYVKSLASDLLRSYQSTFKGIQLNIQADEVLLGIDQAIPCGLILNELITNALKYAFPTGRSGTIWIELRTTPAHLLSLRVADDGVGLPADLDILKNKSLGLQLVNSLVNQLDGSLTVEGSHGAVFKVSFKH